MSKFKILCYLLACTLFLNTGNKAYSQNFKIVTKSAEIVKDKIIVKYDFITYKQNQEFKVWLKVKNSSGKNINIQSVTGDLGDQLKGSKNKEILWNFMEDKILIDDEIEIEVFAELSNSKNSVPVGHSAKAISPVKTMIFSALVPGMGITSVKKKKSYILLSVVTYGALATSFVYNKKSVDNHTLYLNENVISSDSEYFALSTTQKNISNAVLYSAMGTWAINMLWTMTATSKYNKNAANSAFNDKINFNITYLPRIEAAALNISFNLNKK